MKNNAKVVYLKQIEGRKKEYITFLLKLNIVFTVGALVMLARVLGWW